MKIIPWNKIQKKAKRFLKLFNLNIFLPKLGRKQSLSIHESLSYGLFKHQHGIPTKKAVYDIFQPNCSYKTFVISMNKWSLIAALIIMLIMEVNKMFQHPVKHIDSTIIPVCRFKNARKHKTMAGIADYGNSGDGTFFGLKLHLISDLLMNIQSLLFTPGSTSDKDPDTVLKLSRDIWGLLIGDAGYVSGKLSKLFNQEGLRLLMVKPYKNMKKLATKLQGLLYGTRMLIESHFRNLKMFHGLVTSLPRSVLGYFGNYFYSILSYQLS